VSSVAVEANAATARPAATKMDFIFNMRTPIEDS